MNQLLIIERIKVNKKTKILKVQKQIYKLRQQNKLSKGKQSQIFYLITKNPQEQIIKNIFIILLIDPLSQSFYLPNTQLSSIKKQNQLKYMNDSQIQNPEQIVQNFGQTGKSFLKSRDSNRESGSKFFMDNKVRTCSYIKQINGKFVAVPFYDKRDNKIYPTKSEWRDSWTSHIHKRRSIQHIGSMNKTLTGYNINSQRNQFLVPDFIPPYRNTSIIQIGNRSERDKKHWTTTYNNHFRGKSNEIITNNPGIAALKNKWERHQIYK